MYTSHVAEAAGEREGVSCTCEYLGARFSGHHGNLPHLSAIAAESLRRTHRQYMNACIQTYSNIVCAPQLAVTFSLSPPVFLSLSLRFLFTFIWLSSSLNLLLALLPHSSSYSSLSKSLSC